MSTRPNAPALPVIQPSSGNAIIINSCQRLNPVLKEIRNVSKEFGDIVPDFQVGRTTGVLYLSLKYHRLHPEYIHQRIERLGHRYNLRILLILCDISEHQDPIRELTKTCLINNITVIMSWSVDEAALYLTTFKQYEHKPPDLIKERVEKDYNSILRSALTSIKSINKTDVETLRSNCGVMCRSFLGSLAGISRAEEKALLDLPGFAQTKVRRVRDAFHKPFFSRPGPTEPFSLSQISASTAGGIAMDTSQSNALESGAGPDGVNPPAESSTSARRLRSPSPVWDIELDLSDTPSPEETEPSHKKQKTDHPFGQPDRILTVDS
ncbi:restriction endonuclease type II-like protein [Hysterangium stoloniferum]|nr:restriction endonuclease type II-like protein [Hysterangium stoloniferum]